MPKASAASTAVRYAASGILINSIHVDEIINIDNMFVKRNDRRIGSEREAAMDGGLEGVVAAETVLTNIDGATGTWLLRGHPLGEVIAAHGYEGATALLWEGFARTGLTRAAIAEAFAAGRATAFARLPAWLSMA